jgi:hypothetical protein
MKYDKIIAANKKQHFYNGFEADDKFRVSVKYF